MQKDAQGQVYYGRNFLIGTGRQLKRQAEAGACVPLWTAGPQSGKVNSGRITHTSKSMTPPWLFTLVTHIPRSIAFCADVRHAHDLAGVLNEHGISTLAVDGRMSNQVGPLCFWEGHSRSVISWFFSCLDERGECGDGTRAYELRRDLLRIVGGGGVSTCRQLTHRSPVLVFQTPILLMSTSDLLCDFRCPAFMFGSFTPETCSLAAQTLS